MFGDVFLFEFMENRFNFTRLVVKEKFMITWIIEEIVVPLLLVVLLLLNMVKKVGMILSIQQSFILLKTETTKENRSLCNIH